MSDAPKPVADTVTFKLNGEAVSVPKGWTVMQAAVHKGVKIPHFCWHPGLSVAGVCRFCMVRVAGRPKLEIACNLQATEGMEVSTDTEEVKDAHKWALEFHLVNHPLDCPICDQAGECGLQDYYMEVGKYHSQMTRPKVLKPKALDIGGDLVLDTERCILCSRCVRFEEEVTKTGALGIFDRGDRAIVGTYPGKKIDHNYTTNLVDICPVGAFTSKDFRFRQRVWFLKDKPSICPGCSTGCHVDVYAKEQNRKYFRLKPRQSEVNGSWMCDVGRNMYEHLNKEHRVLAPVVAAMPTAASQRVAFEDAIAEVATKLQATPATDIALLVSAQYTCEEYDALLGYFVGKLGVKKVYQWREPAEKIADFDGILYRGDHNANTNGLLTAMKKAGLNAAAAKNEFDDVAKSGAKVVVAFSPEIPSTFPSLGQQLRALAELPYSVVLGLPLVLTEHKFDVVIPTKGFAEKTGTLLNYQGKIGELATPFPKGVDSACDLGEFIRALQDVAARLRA